MKAIGSNEHDLPLISFLDPDIVVSPSDVHFREEFGTLQFVNEGGDEGKGVGIFNSMFIEGLIVLETLHPFFEQRRKGRLEGIGIFGFFQT